VDNVLSDPPVVMQLIAGAPTQVTVSVDPNTMPVNSTEMAEVIAVVRDTTGNPVGDGVGVLFSTNLGSISPPEVPTIGGEATTWFSPSTNAGTAWIKAQVGIAIDSTLLTITPSTPSQIGLSAQSATIQVVGTGGDYQTDIYANVTDASGNLVLNDVMVHFRIQNDGFPFGGVNINNHGFEDSTLTAGGIATVSLNAGINSGPVTIKAWTYDAALNEISAQSPLVTIVSGPPAAIDIGINSLDPVQAGGNVWQVEVSALVLDQHGNEVVDSTAVQFYLSDDTSSVEIWGDAFTGNDPPVSGGDPLEGVAFTSLLYHSDATFTDLDVYAYCVVDGDSIIDTTQYQCPLADGELSFILVPENWNFTTPPIGPSYGPAVQQARAYLLDGYANPIDGATIIFNSTAGYFYWDSLGTVLSFEKITGPPGFIGPPPEPPDSTGTAICWLRTTLNQAFPDLNAVINTATVYARVNNSDVTSENITVTFSKDGH
jgi:hypothetical protein